MKATEHGPAANGDPLFVPENETRIAANRIAHVRSPSLQHSRTYMGSVMSFLVTGAHTGGRFAMMEYRAKPGNEPPPHVHEWEDEFYHVLDGSAEFHCGAERLRAIAGDYIFLPQGRPHTFDILSPEIRMTIIVCSTSGRPVALDRYFVEMSEPASSLDLPSGAITYATADPSHAIGIAAAYGIHILSPQEAARAMPNYPGFGARR